MFTPPLNTLWRRDLNRNILDLIENGYRVNVFGQIPGAEGNNLKVDAGGLKVATPEPVEDDSQKKSRENGQEKGGSHPLDALLKGFEGALF